MEYLLIIISAIFVNNIVLSQFLGVCPFVGVSRNISTALGMAGAVSFVMVISTIVTWLARHYILIPLHIEFLQTIAFILVIASLVQLVEIILKKSSPALYQALGVFLPLITTNCAILGVAILAVQKNYGLIEGVVFALANALGFGLAIILFAGLREHLDFVTIPKAMDGVPISLIMAGILSMVFMGFSGMV